LFCLELEKIVGINLTEYSRNCVSFDAAARYDNALLIVLAAVDEDANGSLGCCAAGLG
jgi:hypothetical protein